MQKKICRRARMRAALTALTGTILLGPCLLPQAAGAASVGTNTSQGLYIFSAANNEANTLTIDADETNYTFTDSVPISDASGACTPLSATSLRCPRTQGATPMSRITVALSLPGAIVPPPDTAPNTFSYTGQPPAGTATEPGLRVDSQFSETRDQITGSSGNDLIRAGDGADTVSGAGGDDVILASGFGPSTYSGGDGNDEIRANGDNDQTISGGDGDDRLEDAGRMFGDAGDDSLTNHGDYGGLEGDLLDGGAGDDQLVELPDSNDCSYTVADTNIGGPGKDSVFDDCGIRDIFKLADGEPDRWHCGGFTGVAELDPSDEVVAPKDFCAEGPETTWRRTPYRRTSKHTATFSFNTDNREATFECKLDKERFKECESPKKYSGLKDGEHTLHVRAVAGSLLGKAERFRWKIG
jgi:Ca2+-binding RTX toxin-like protein